VSARPRVVIVDDHHLFRSGVRVELGEELSVVGDAGTVEEAVAVIREQRPDVVLLDVHMPDGGGVEVITRVGEECAAVRFLYKEVAQRLGISVKTVEAHVSAVLRKLQLSSRHELSRWAVQRRLVSLDGP
jgi:DNA-binding NarL/FixJ family response regulator